MPTAEVINLSKSYGPNRALADVSLSLAAGSIHALLGGNGSGKSTLIKCLAGVVAADEGTFRTPTGEWAASSQTPALAKVNRLRFVHQQNSTFADLSVAENLGIGGRFKSGRLGRIDWSEQRRHAREVLERFNIPASPNDRMENLGAAVKMLIAIARAMQDIDSSAQGLLVLDEPTVSLPRNEVDFLLESLRGLAAAGQSIMLVTHRLAEVEQIATEATVLRDGRVAARLDSSQLDQEVLVRSITGKETAVTSKSAARETSRVVFRYEPADDSSPLVLHAGECVGIAGLLSSGRSSLLKRVFGVIPRGDDQLTVNGMTVAPGSVRTAMGAGVALVPEDRAAEALFSDLSLSQNLSITNIAAHRRRAWLSSHSEATKAKDLIADFSVKTVSTDVQISALSGGNQQKVILARWMQRNPAVLLLDEPTQGIDIGAREEIHRLIDAAVQDGLAVLYVTSDFEELAAICHRVVLVRAGRVVGEVPRKQLSEEGIYQSVFSKESLK